MPSWTTYYVVLFWPCLAVVVGLCLIYGDRPLKIASSIFSAAMIVGRLTLSHPMYSTIEWIPFLIDAALVVGLVLLTIRHPRSWLYALSAVQFITLLGHLTRILHLHASRLTYALLTGSGGYPTIALLSFGLIITIRRRRIETSRRASD